jgi:hypothetical protein
MNEYIFWRKVFITSGYENQVLCPVLIPNLILQHWILKIFDISTWTVDLSILTAKVIYISPLKILFLKIMGMFSNPIE